MISKERTLVLQARNDQLTAERQLSEEQDRVKALEESLSQSELKLRILTEQNEKLKEMQKPFSKNQYTEGSLRMWNVHVDKRKCKISSRGIKPIMNSSKLNLSQQKTLKKLKHRLSQKKVTLVEAKSSISVIKKDIDDLRFGKGKLRRGLQKDSFSEVNQMRRLQIHRGIPLDNRDPITKVIMIGSADFGSHSESHWILGKIAHENGSKLRYSFNRNI